MEKLGLGMDAVQRRENKVLTNKEHLEYVHNIIYTVKLDFSLHFVVMLFLSEDPHHEMYPNNIPQ